MITWWGRKGEGCDPPHTYLMHALSLPRENEQQGSSRQPIRYGQVTAYRKRRALATSVNEPHLLPPLAVFRHSTTSLLGR